MYKNKRILAVIPARGGSKGIPSKNIFNIDGYPLIKYTLDCANNSKYIDKVIVSTDNQEIKKVAEQYGGNVPFMRPSELAEDHSKTIHAVIHVIDTLKKMGETYDYVVLLQNTVPLRKHIHVDKAIQKIIDRNENSLVSVTEVEQHPILMRTLDKNEHTHNLLNMNSTVRRQDFPKYYRVDGAIYIQKIDENFNLETSFNDGKLAYIMNKKYSTDIDTYKDIKVIEYYLEKERKTKMREGKF